MSKGHLMKQYQEEFIEFAIEMQVLRFGEFKLKSGRISPYFFNSGLFNDGKSLKELGKYYACAVKHAGLKFDMIYGPAYKGIPLASTLAITFQEQYQENYPFCFNRKEAKDHGEKGITFGASINGRVLIVDDVISAGTSLRESKELINAKGGIAMAAVVSVDRQEYGEGPLSAIEEIEQLHNIQVISIVTLDDIITYLITHSDMSEHIDAIKTYKQKYGSKQK